MEIEIWSDIMCPFCYIGKRKLEFALKEFKHKDRVNISWRSFLLQPDLKYEEGKDIYTFLETSKGLQQEQVKSMTQQVSNMAKEVGLNYNFDSIMVANTFDAHRFTHFAAHHGLQNEAEEKLFKAYFEEGKNVADHGVLIEMGKELGLNENAIKKMLDSGEFTEQVKEDVNEAQKLQIRGVPFFVFNRKYGVSGAQPVEVFLETLQKAMEDEVALIQINSDENSSCEEGSCST